MSQTINVPRELLERVVKADASNGASSVDLVDGWKAMEQIRAILATTRRPEGDGQAPVAAQVRFRRPEKGLADWSVWQQTTIKPNTPAWSIDSVGYEVEYRLLYTTPQPSAVQGVNQQLLEALENTATWIEQLPVPTVGAAGQLVKIDKAIAAAREGGKI